MGNAQIIFDEGEKHTVQITIPAILPIVNYLPRIEVRKSSHSEIILHYDTTIQIIGQDVMLTIPATDSEGISGRYMWQLMLEKVGDPDDVIKFTADLFIIIPAITQKEIIP